MKNHTLILIALILMAFTPGAVAEIYRCEGPDGPIFSDKKCGPDAESVEVTDSAGLTGVTDEVKAELAQKKADRQQAREEMRKLDNNRTVINNQFTTVNTQPYGRWLNPYWGSRPDKPKPPEVKPRPLPSTLGKPRR